MIHVCVYAHSLLIHFLTRDVLYKDVFSLIFISIETILRINKTKTVLDQWNGTDGLNIFITVVTISECQIKSINTYQKNGSYQNSIQNYGYSYKGKHHNKQSRLINVIFVFYIMFIKHILFPGHRVISGHQSIMKMIKIKMVLNLLFRLKGNKFLRK